MYYILSCSSILLIFNYNIKQILKKKNTLTLTLQEILLTSSLSTSRLKFNPNNNYHLSLKYNNLFNLTLNNFYSVNSFMEKNLSQIKENIFILNPYYKLSKQVFLLGLLNKKYKFINKKFYRNFSKLIINKKKFNKTKKFKKQNIKIVNYLFNLKRKKKTKLLFKQNQLYFFVKYSLIKKKNNFNILKVRKKKSYFVKKKLLKKKKLHLMFFNKIKIKIKKARFVYQFFFKKTTKELTTFFKKIMKSKLNSNSIYLYSLLNDVFYFIPSLKIIDFIKKNHILVNRTIVKSIFFLLNKADLVEIIISKQLLLSLFFSLYLKVKSYNNILKKK